MREIHWTCAMISFCGGAFGFLLGTLTAKQRLREAKDWARMYKRQNDELKALFDEAISCPAGSTIGELARRMKRGGKLDGPA